jgi:TPR repeat protein
MAMMFKAAVAAFILVAVLGFAALVATNRPSNESDDVAASGGPAVETYEGAVTAYNQGDYATALRQFRSLADKGTLAQYSLGLLYDGGSGVTENHAEAAKWYRKAADQGDALAQYRLGYLYDSGSGVTENHAEAAKWYRMAADQGNDLAQYSLGLLYDSGSGVTRDPATAAKWYRQAADQGNARAQFELGSMYLSGRGVPRNYILAHMWWKLVVESGRDKSSAVDDAARGLVVLAKIMAPPQIAEAQKLAREWRPNKAYSLTPSSR